MVIKDIHMFCAGATITLFVLRGIWMMRESPIFRQRWTKIVPPIVDTVLLGTGVTMAIQTEQYPGREDWLTAKLTAVVVYIVLGAVGLNYGSSRRMRIMFWVAAILVFAYVVSVARTRSPLPFL